MTMSLPRPSAVGTRPAYLDNLFRDAPTTPSTHSSTSSFSCGSTASNYDLRSAYHTSRPLTPAVEEDQSDTFSVRSKKSFMTPRRFKLGSILHRRTYPQGDDLELSRPSTGRPSAPQSEPSSPMPPPSSPPSVNPTHVHPTSRRPSLPKLQTNFPPPRAISTYAKKPLPAVPGQQAPLPKRESSRPKMERQQSNASGAELNCQRCYYFAARNCNGYVLGGEAGDACEMCLQSGYFGAK